jgi:hypothetical protein
MDVIAHKLNSGKLFTDIEALGFEYFPENYFTCMQITPYQWEVISLDQNLDDMSRIIEIINDYTKLSFIDIQRESPIQYAYALGCALSQKETDRVQFFNEILSGAFTFKLENWEVPDLESVDDEISINLIKKTNPNIKPRRYRCKVRVTKSGNIYGYREIEDIP